MDSNFDKYVTPNMLSLNDIYAVKVLISYFLNQINRPVSPKQLTEIATGDGLVNYFFFMEAVSSMLETNMMTLEYPSGVPQYVLQEKGKRCAIEFKSIVPQSFRDRIMSAGLKLFARLKDESSVDFSIEEKKIGCMLNCVCHDNEELELMRISLFAPDKQQAEYMQRKIMENPSAFYSKIVDYLIENEEYVPEYTDDE